MPVRGQLLEHAHIGRRSGLGPFDHRQLEVREEHLSKLWRRVQVELPAGQLEDLRLDRAELPPEPDAHVPEERRIDQDADFLHPGQDAHERHLDLVHQLLKTRLLQLRFQLVRQAERGFRAEGGEASGIRDRHLVKADLRLPRSRDILPRVERDAQALARQSDQVVMTAAGVDHVGGDHHVGAKAPHRDSGAPQRQRCLLEVVADLPNSRIG